MLAAVEGPLLCGHHLRSCCGSSLCDISNSVLGGGGGVLIRMGLAAGKFAPAGEMN